AIGREEVDGAALLLLQEADRHQDRGPLARLQDHVERGAMRFEDSRARVKAQPRPADDAVEPDITEGGAIAARRLRRAAAAPLAPHAPHLEQIAEIGGEGEIEAELPPLAAEIAQPDPFVADVLPDELAPLDRDQVARQA